MSQTIDVHDLLKAGAHFGHKVSRWNPKMAPFIHSDREGIHIIDLIQTAEKLGEALDFIESVASTGKQVLFVGTKRQAQDVVRAVAHDTSMPYITERWLGGLLTNFATMQERIKHMKELEAQLESGELEDKYVKKEILDFEAEAEKLNSMFGGIRDMERLPGLLVVADVPGEGLAIREAKKLNIPVVALVDTNADPTLVDYPIPANDDAIKTIKYVFGVISEAVANGAAAAKIKKTDEDEEVVNKSKTKKTTTPAKKKSVTKTASTTKKASAKKSDTPKKETKNSTKKTKKGSK